MQIRRVNKIKSREQHELRVTGAAVSLLEENCSEI